MQTTNSSLLYLFVRAADPAIEGAKAVTLDWGGAPRTFLLGKASMDELQQRLRIGPSALLMKLRGGTWTTDDVRETIALGLRGAGMSAKDIEPLIAANCDNIPIAPSAAVAALIIGAALYGTSKADVG